MSVTPESRPQLQVKDTGSARPELQTKIPQGARIYEMIGKRLQADYLKIYRRYKDPELDRVYGQPGQSLSGTISEPFVRGVWLVIDLYPSIVGVSQEIENVPLEGEATINDAFEQKRKQVTRKLAEIKASGKSVPEELELVDALGSDPSGSTWLEKRAKVEIQGGPTYEGEILDPVIEAEKLEELRGALSAIHGAKKLYEELVVKSTSTPTE